MDLKQIPKSNSKAGHQGTDVSETKEKVNNPASMPEQNVKSPVKASKAETIQTARKHISQ